MRMRGYWPIVAAALAAGCGDKHAQGGAASAGAGQPAAAAPAAAPAANGAAVFARTCQTCHQANGLGLANTFPPLAGSEIANGEKPRLIRLVLHGMTGAVTVQGKRFNNVMPPWKSLSDADLAAVLSYVRSSFGNSAPAVTAEEVARERAATSSRTMPWAPVDLGLH